ncbi:hypothetical protein [Helicobacter cinaedi]|uniref:hypothetical protein n=1 Tax=Helicobacter cinaedi TaxID=213 RepID=UPI000D7CDCC6|nr:hypothetical protein [Helicobacter cinaedi]
MQIILHITNADDNLLKALKGVINLYPQAKVKVKKERDITANGYTQEFEEEILNDIKDIEKQRKLGTLKTYNSVEEAFKSEGLI